jgi:hypothetical protein
VNAVLLAREPGASYPVGSDYARSVNLFRVYQTRIYEGALFGPADRVGNRQVFDHALAFAAQRLRFRGTPVLLDVLPLASDPFAATQLPRLPDILCIGEFMWGRPVHDLTQMFSSATLIWLQDQFAPPLDARVRAQLRELDWDRVAVDWSW